MTKLMIEFAAAPEDFERARAYLDSAKTPAERNVRKMQLHARLYSTGPQKLLELKEIRSVLYSPHKGKSHDNQKP